MGHFKYQKCKFSKWAKFDSLPIEQACFVLMDIEPPPLEYLRFQQSEFSPNHAPTWEEPNGYQDLLRSLKVSVLNKSVAVNRMIEYPHDTIHVTWVELVRWAGSKGYDIPSDLSEIVTSLSRTNSEGAAPSWPWGQHTTTLLGHLDLAARKFWVNYDPTDATTAPTNTKVAEWLVTEGRLSQKAADSIASILRADDLPTGPRK